MTPFGHGILGHLDAHGLTHLFYNGIPEGLGQGLLGHFLTKGTCHPRGRASGPLPPRRTLRTLRRSTEPAVPAPHRCPPRRPATDLWRQRGRTVPGPGAETCRKIAPDPRGWSPHGNAAGKPHGEGSRGRLAGLRQNPLVGHAQEHLPGASRLYRAYCQEFLQIHLLIGKRRRERNWLRSTFTPGIWIALVTMVSRAKLAGWVGCFSW